MNSMSRLQTLLRVFVVLSVLVLGGFTTTFNASAITTPSGATANLMATNADVQACPNNLPVGGVKSKGANQNAALLAQCLTKSSHHSSNNHSSHANSDSKNSSSNSKLLTVPVTPKVLKVNSNKHSSNSGADNKNLSSKNTGQNSNLDPKGKGTDPKSTNKTTLKTTSNKLSNNSNSNNGSNDPPSKNKSKNLTSDNTKNSNSNNGSNDPPSKNKSKNLTINNTSNDSNSNNTSNDPSSKNKSKDPTTLNNSKDPSSEETSESSHTQKLEKSEGSEVTGTSSGESGESTKVQEQEQDVGHEVSSSSSEERRESDRVQDRENSSGEEVSSEEANESASEEDEENESASQKEEENESSSEEAAENENTTTTTTVVTSALPTEIESAESVEVEDLEKAAGSEVTTINGTISSMDETTDNFMIGNTQVHISEDAENNIELQDGDVVTLAGVQMPDGTFQATSIDNVSGNVVDETNASTTSVSGTVSSLDETNDTFMVGNTPVQIGESAESGVELENGDSVTVTGVMEGNTLDATSLSNISGPTTSNNGD
jgi:hypothetical protein